MTAEQIRTVTISQKTQYGNPIENTGVEEFQCAMLQEIAAQLAEHNEILRAIHPELLLPEECRNQKCDYYVGYLAYGGPEMSHEAYHSQATQAEQHFKHCGYSGPNTCKTCERYEQRLRA